MMQGGKYQPIKFSNNMQVTKKYLSGYLIKQITSRKLYINELNKSQMLEIDQSIWLSIQATLQQGTHLSSHSQKIWQLVKTNYQQIMSQKLRPPTLIQLRTKCRYW